MTPRAGLHLGRGCFARGEGGVRDGPLASAGGRPLRWGRPGNWAAPVWGETDDCWAGLGFRPGFGPQSV
jgi:hypothetical protein